MTDKTMVSDTLAGINGELVRYGEMISQTENQQLKQTLKQMRNQCEMSQEEIYQIARAKVITFLQHVQKPRWKLLMCVLY